ncbi:MAG: AraC family transcriptional regulator [Clostridia bacterium]|nr:AraC family transcriptional regulator [Clostridia bacterium]
MHNAFSYLTPEVESLTISPKMVQLFIPPVKWRGDPKGHIGTYDTFFFIVSGECSLMIEDTSVILKAGSLAFLPKDKLRSYANMSRDITLYEINFEAKINGKSWRDAIFVDDDTYFIMPENPEQVKSYFEDSVRYEFNKDIMYDVVLCSNLLHLIRIFLTEKAKLESSARPFKTVTDYMKKNLSRTIKISELSELVFMEETYFIKRFKRALGDSPISYLNKLRIYEAMKYLADGTLSLGEICHKVGIYDSSYFSKLFKSYSGITPGEYRDIFK